MGGGGAYTNPPGWLHVHVGQCTWGRACGSAHGGSCARVGSLPALPPVVRCPCAQARGSDAPPLGLRAAPGGSHSLREPRVPPVMGNGGRGERGGRARTPENRRVCPPPICVHHPCHSCMHPPWANRGGEGWGAPTHPPVLACTPVPFARTPLLFSCAPPPICTHPLLLVHAPPSRPHAPPCPRGGACMSSHSRAPPPPRLCMHPPPQLWVNRGRGGVRPHVLLSVHAPPSGSRECPSPCSHPGRGCTQRRGEGGVRRGKGVADGGIYTPSPHFLAGGWRGGMQANRGLQG
jgi:hypothetical protein